MPKRVAGAIVAAVFIVFSGVVEGVDATEKKIDAVYDGRPVFQEVYGKGSCGEADFDDGE